MAGVEKTVPVGQTARRGGVQKRTVIGTAALRDETKLCDWNPEEESIRSISCCLTDNSAAVSSVAASKRSFSSMIMPFEATEN